MAKTKGEKVASGCKIEITDGHPQEDFEVTYKTAEKSECEPQTELASFTDKKVKESLRRAVATYDPENKVYSTYLGNTDSSDTLTQSKLSQLAEGAQDDIQKIKQINGYIRKYIIIDDIIGLVHSSVNSNINTDFRLDWQDVSGKKKQVTTQLKAKEIIDDFNKQINIRNFIREAVMTTWDEGNYICYLRMRDGNYVIDSYPLGIAEISAYKENGRPIVLINMDELKSSLKKTILRGKNNKALFFEDTLQDIKNNFGQEVYDAYTSKTKVKYCRLNTAYTGVARVNNLRRKYGVSFIFRALPSALMLSTLQTADESVAKARQKKIIHQVLRKEALGTTQREMLYDQLTWAHDNLLKAWKQPNTVVTTPPCVEKIEYVEPKVEDISAEKQKSYRSKELSSLGISFLTNDNSQTASTANISWEMLSRMIDTVCEQVEDIISDFYRTVLAENGIKDEMYIPKIKIQKSSLLDIDTRMELAKLVYGTLNSSRQTAFEMLGIDLENEKVRRESENNDSLDTIFTPRPTAYNSSGDVNAPGRPSSKTPQNKDKQDYDNNYNKEGRS